MLASLPDVMIGVVIILVLSASMSTLSSLVLTSGSTLTLDIISPAVSRKGNTMKEHTQLLCIRLLVLFFIVVSSVLAIVQAKSSVTFIAQLMGISWGALAGAFLAPFLYGLYWKRTTPAAVWASFIVGVGVMCGCMYGTFTGHMFISPFLSSPINAGVLAMLLGLVVVPLVSAFTRVKNKESVKGMFACYERTVTVRASTSLRDEEE
jgi:SSS family solute:Na+ symporter